MVVSLALGVLRPSGRGQAALGPHVCVVDHSGHVIAHSRYTPLRPGATCGGSYIVARLRGSPRIAHYGHRAALHRGRQWGHNTE